MKNNRYRWILWGGGVFFVAIFPYIFGIYYTNFFIAFAIFSLYAVTLNLLLGYMGVLSFGHAMFFGTGAYATAPALTHIQGFPLLPAILVGGVSGGEARAVADNKPSRRITCCRFLIRCSRCLVWFPGADCTVVGAKWRRATGRQRLPRPQPRSSVTRTTHTEFVSDESTAMAFHPLGIRS